MKFIANINIMPREELLDPQGKATAHGLKNLGFDKVSNVRIGKRIQLEIDATNEGDAQKKLNEACEKLLANLIMEKFEVELKKI